EAWNADNTGTATDVDATAGTSGYQGMTLALLQSKYDQGIKNVAVPAAGFTLTATDYCVSSTVAQYVFFKHGPGGDIKMVNPAASPAVTLCDA
ncbi:MAG: hypothetical protein QOE36_1163, partial [Gaiellaceae bacterium]|nr:hypothetical protein [Gaiellaceae bacterium]